MASNHTSNYGLSQWEATDAVLRTDFNEDNAKIDTALKSQADSLSNLSAQMVNKANTGAVNSLASQLEQEIQDRTEAMEAEAEARIAGLALKGNVQVAFTSYVGTGKCGPENKSKLRFSKQPLLAYIVGDSAAQIVRGASGLYGLNGFSSTGMWEGNTFYWWNPVLAYQMNTSGVTYTVIVFYEC